MPTPNANTRTVAGVACSGGLLTGTPISIAVQNASAFDAGGGIASIQDTAGHINLFAYGSITGNTLNSVTNYSTIVANEGTGTGGANTSLTCTGNYPANSRIKGIAAEITDAARLAVLMAAVQGAQRVIGPVRPGTSPTTAGECEYNTTTNAIDCGINNTTKTLATTDNALIAGAEQTANKGQPSGYAPLDASSQVPIGNLPVGTTATTVAVGNDVRITGAEQSANKSQPSGYAPLDASSKVPTANLPVGTAAGTIAAGDDTRFTDARTPTAHASTHRAAGSDPLATTTPGANAVPQAGTGGQLATGWVPVMTASGASHAPGLVPDAGATAGTTRFLREDATFAAVPPTAANEFYAANYASLKVAVDTIGATPGRLVIDSTRPYGAATTVPSTLTLEFRGNGQIDCANAGSAVTIQGPIISAAGQKIFLNCTAGGAGSILFTNNFSVSAVTPEMWGGTPDNVTNRATEIGIAILAAVTLPTPTVQLSAGTYQIGASLNVKAGLTMRGRGMDQTTLFLANGANVDAIKNLTTSIAALTFEDFTLDVNGANQGTTTGGGIVMQLATEVTIRRVRIKNARSSAIYLYRSGTNAIIEDCQISNAGIVANATSYGIRVIGGSNFQILHNRVVTVSGPGDHVSGMGIGVFPNGAPVEPTDYGIISDNFVTGTNGIGIATSSSDRLTIRGNNVSACGGNGIDIGKSVGLAITGNVINACYGGIVSDPGGVAGKASLFAITGNTIRDTTGSQPCIGVWGEATVTGNTIDRCAYAGISLNDGDDAVISSNVVGRTQGSIGISLFTSSSGKSIQHVIISDNRVFDDQGTPTQTYGIRLYNSTGATLDSISVLNNDLFTGGTTANFAPAAGPGTAPTSLTVRTNKGYVTENSGLGTIASGTTSVVVTHGLAKTPVAADLALTFTNNPTNAVTGWWLSNLTATQFTVNVRNDPGASGLTFSWQGFVH